MQVAFLYYWLNCFNILKPFYHSVFDNNLTYTKLSKVQQKRESNIYGAQLE